MATEYRRQLARLCNRQETLKDAEVLLNSARSKTGPGSGHDLGKNAIALPAICAFLASERLGNNDVIKKVAQTVSCVKPKDFEAALSTVQGALGTTSGYRLPAEQSTLSPRKSLRNIAAVAGPSTPTPARSRPIRLHQSRVAGGSDVEMEDVRAEAADDDRPSDSKEVKPPPCRHYQPVLADRLFYQYRDPRVLHEWETCEKEMKALVERYGDPFGELVAH